jgi:hypothetical protein
MGGKEEHEKPLAFGWDSSQYSRPEMSDSLLRIPADLFSIPEANKLDLTPTQRGNITFV